MRSHLVFFMLFLSMQYCYCQKFTFQDSGFKADDYTYLYRISFTINKTELRLGKQAQLDSLVIWLIKNPNLVVEIGVHVSGLEPNQKLSELRAVTLLNYMTKKGVKNEQIKCIG